MCEFHMWKWTDDDRHCSDIARGIADSEALVQDQKYYNNLNMVLNLRRHALLLSFYFCKQIQSYIMHYIVMFLIWYASKLSEKIWKNIEDIRYSWHDDVETTIDQ